MGHKSYDIEYVFTRLVTGKPLPSIKLPLIDFTTSYNQPYPSKPNVIKYKIPLPYLPK